MDAMNLFEANQLQRVSSISIPAQHFSLGWILVSAERYLFITSHFHIHVLCSSVLTLCAGMEESACFSSPFPYSRSRRWSRPPPSTGSCSVLWTVWEEWATWPASWHHLSLVRRYRLWCTWLSLFMILYGCLCWPKRVLMHWLVIFMKLYSFNPNRLFSS